MSIPDEDYSRNTSYELNLIYVFITVDGGWTDWSPFSLCSVTCGDGIQVATRECTNPEPENNGKKCIGSSTNAQECKVEDCVGKSF